MALAASPVTSGPEKKTRVCVAPTGLNKSKIDHPLLPMSVPEIAACARSCFDAGASMIHVHVRDKRGRASLSPKLLRTAIDAIFTEVPGMTIQIATESHGAAVSVEQRLRLIRNLKPAAVSLAVRELGLKPRVAAKIYDFCAKNGIAVQHVIHDYFDLRLLKNWIEAGTVPTEMNEVLLVIGGEGPDQRASIQDLEVMVREMGTDFPHWMACAYGADEELVLRRAAQLGGDVRVGFENNIFRPDGSISDDNTEAVGRLVRALTAA